MKEKIIKVFYWLKSFFVKFAYRLRPRAEARWIIVTVIWVLLLAYVINGIFFSVRVYKNHADSNTIRFMVKIYPYPAAFVNGDIVWMKDFYQQMSYIKQFDLKTGAAFSEPEVRGQVLNQLIENQIIQWQASKNGIRVTSKDVDDAYQKIVAEKGETEVKKVIKDLYGMDVSDFKALIKAEVLKEKVQDQLIAQIKVVHIFTKNEARANEAANKAKSGEDFAALAKAYSEDVKTRDQGGDLGWIARGDLMIDGKTEPEFEDVAFAAKIGEFVGPVKTQVGFEIARVDDKKGKIQKSYADWVADSEKSVKIIHILR